MLKRIECDAFKQKAVDFHMGLNTVVGDGKNSIGKSTFLMIIDYCFGGEDYFTKEEVTRNIIGPHDIRFVFEFDGKSYYFIRNSHVKNRVDVCDENFEVKRTITLEYFKAWLGEKYGLLKSDLSLRGYISPYFRIYNRGTHNELRPLNSTVREPDEKGVAALLKMYGLYEPIEDINRRYKEASDNKSVYGSLKKVKGGHIAANADERNRLAEEIVKLRKELDELDIDNSNGTADAELIAQNRRDELILQRKQLKKQKADLERKLTNIQFDDGYSEESFAKNFRTLLEFFPGVDEVNVPKLTEINNFHKNVASNLKEESQNSNRDIESLIRMIDSQIAEIDKELAGLAKPTKVNEAVLRRYGQILADINEKQVAIDNFDAKVEVDKTFDEVKKEREQSVESYLRNLSGKINTELKNLNRLIRQQGDKLQEAPTIQINSLDSYTYFIQNDTGTGSRYKSVCMLDIVIAKQTLLPAFVHDSIMFANIYDGSCVDLIKQYDLLTTKQVFIGVDKASKYDDGDNPNIAIQRRVLQLGIGENALFGRQFNLSTEE